MRELSDGRLRRGEVLPTESQLAASRQAARHALQSLAPDGPVKRIPGKGTVASHAGSGVAPVIPATGPPR
jgi:DNA-binding GntR family transcriptional regulator